ncbi:MAG TPA: hypothetical protein VFG46_08930 [Chryseolinea sp.]|nr:hypothetical protein [Chryseolinea sp.]
MQEDAPPLKVWAYAGSTIFILLSLFLSFAYSGFGPYAKIVERSNQNLEGALMEINKDTSAISIVFLGSSLTEDAIEDPAALEEAISKLTNKKVNILRVAIYFLNIDLAKRIDVFKYIAKHPPEYLFIENFAINLEEGDLSSKVPEQITTTLFYLRNGVRKKIGLNTHDDYYVKWHSFDTNPTPDFYLDDFDSITYKLLLNGRTSVRQISQNAIANEAYEVLQKKGTKVVFLDMPQTNDFEKNFLDERGTAELNKLLDHYKQQYNVEYWPFTGSICDSCYIDGIHLNYKGSPQYQEWFAAELASRR